MNSTLINILSSCLLLFVFVPSCTFQKPTQSASSANKAAPEISEDKQTDSESEEELPRLIIDLGIPFSWVPDVSQSKYKFQVNKLVLRLMDVSGNKVVKEIVLPAVDDALWMVERDWSPMLVFDNFFQEEGEYLLVVDWPDRDASFEQKIIVQRGDIEISVEMLFLDTKRITPDGPENRVDYFLASFTVSIVHPSGSDVVLVRNWKPVSNGKPKYIIKNESAQVISCVDPMSPFVGSIYKEIDEKKWKLLIRGRTHDSRAHPNEIGAGGKRWSEEVVYETKPIPFDVGRYQFRVRYLKTNWGEGMKEREEEPGTYNDYYEAYELVDEFEIAN